MAGRFMLRRSELAREQDRRNGEDNRAAIARFVDLASALADRMESEAAADLASARQRAEHVAVLRRAAEQGRTALRRRDAEREDRNDATG